MTPSRTLRADVSCIAEFVELWPHDHLNNKAITEATVVTKNEHYKRYANCIGVAAILHRCNSGQR